MIIYNVLDAKFKLGNYVVTRKIINDETSWTEGIYSDGGKSVSHTGEEAENPIKE